MRRDIASSSFWLSTRASSRNRRRYTNVPKSAPSRMTSRPAAAATMMMIGGLSSPPLVSASGSCVTLSDAAASTAVSLPAATTGAAGAAGAGSTGSGVEGGGAAGGAPGGTGASEKSSGGRFCIKRAGWLGQRALEGDPPPFEDEEA